MSDRQVNFQINCFSEEKREEFKNWCGSNRLSMREMMYLMMEEKEKIQPIIEEALIQTKPEAPADGS